MPIHALISNIARPFIRQQAGNIYRVLRAQDRVVDYTYRKTGLYNRGVVEGIKHGLIAGQAIGGGLQLGLNAPDTPGNQVGFPSKKRQRFTSRKSYKTRGRYPRCPSRRYTSK